MALVLPRVARPDRGDARRAQGRRRLPAARPAQPAERMATILRGRRPGGCPHRPGRRLPDALPPARDRRWTRRRGSARRRRTDAQRRAPAAPGRARVRHLHLRLHRRAQGRGGHPPQRGAAVRRHRGAGSTSGPTTCGRCSTPSPSTSRCGSCGARCCTAAAWSSCRTRSPALAASSSCGCWPPSGSPCSTRRPSAFYQLIAADRDEPAPTWRCATWSSAARRSTRAGSPLVRPARPGRSDAGQHVRHHRDHRARHAPPR